VKFMLLLKSDKEIEAGVLPSETQLSEFAQYNGDLVRSGVLLAAEGLHPSARGVRVKAAGERSTVLDGPFTETKELVAGFWVIQVKSLDEAVEWVRRMPSMDGRTPEIEIRQCMEQDDFGDALTPELRATEDRLRAEGTARLQAE
jgi:hypothetical protein